MKINDKWSVSIYSHLVFITQMNLFPNAPRTGSILKPGAGCTNRLRIRFRPKAPAPTAKAGRNTAMTEPNLLGVRDSLLSMSWIFGVAKNSRE